MIETEHSANAQTELGRWLEGTGAAIARTDPRALDPDADPIPELESVAKAVPKRRREFAAGRLCARAAMRLLGAPEAPIVMDSDRSPRWPSGLVGSISHTDHACIAVVGRDGELGGVGVDVEKGGPLKRELWKEVCTPAERRWLEQFGEHEAGLLAKVVFGAKEAFYKAQHPRTKTFLGFQQVALELDVGRREFRVAQWPDAIRDTLRGFTLRGHYAIHDDSVLSAYVLRAR